MKKLLSSLVLMALSAGICSAQSILYFPQFADGAADKNSVVWGSVIGVSNLAALGTPAASGTITLTKDNGTPLNVALTDPLTGTVGNAFQLAGGQTKLFFSTSILNSPLQPLNVGFVTVTSNLPVAAAVIFINYSPYLNSSLSGPAIAQATVLAATPLTRQAMVFAKFPNNDEGIAIANPQASTATISFQLIDNAGTPVGAPVTRTLQPNNHTAFFVSELFPNAFPLAFIGSLRITSDNPVVATALNFQGALFSTSPVFPLP